ncbi:MAG: metallophosphoesterase family protein [Lachnospiraceae bacterium]|nr:metallophosphoesterase family protein [Lachnospiraceae bacterium]
MAVKTRIGIICDMHLPDDERSPQYIFLQYAVEQMKKDGVNTVICLGDITSYGEVGAWNLYCDALKDFKHYEVLGNSDVRDAATRYNIADSVENADFCVGERQVIGINTPDGEITAIDRERLEKIKAGDIVFLHHYIQSLKEESRTWLSELAERVPITILHGHGHRHFDYYIKDTHVLGMRGLDPDKAIGDFPCMNYLEISENQVDISEVVFSLPKKDIEKISEFFGISCVDNAKDVAYATEYSVKYVELRCNGSTWKPDMTLLPTLEAWRKKTKGYLSVHMPNLYYMDGEISGTEQWMEALNYAILVKADGLTIHPPKVRLSDMPKGGDVWKELLALYVYAAKSVPRTTKVGIENLHKSRKEHLDEYRKFGYTPEEVSSWIEAINAELGEERVGHVLDVGHARNNGALSQKYPISKWYSIMGQKTTAYHIHQVLRIPEGLKNHNAIESWFGPMINYTSFFYAWHHNMINHVPIFLEVKGCENHAKSMEAFKSFMKKI